jgi:hypothetical protein
LQCKYVAVDASVALAAIFQEVLDREPGDVGAAQAWARILRAPPLEQREEGCEVLERVASVSKRPGTSLLARMAAVENVVRSRGRKDAIERSWLAEGMANECIHD